MPNWVNVFDKRYHDHFGQDPEYMNLLVQWEAENGNAPILTNEAVGLFSGFRVSGLGLGFRVQGFGFCKLLLFLKSMTMLKRGLRTL